MSNLDQFISGSLNQTYRDGEYVGISGRIRDTENTTANRAYMFPFIIPAGIGINRIAVQRGGAATGNMICGIYDQAFALQTDCSEVTIPNSAGFELVPTTEVFIRPNEFYWCQVRIAVSNIIFASEADSSNLADREPHENPGIPIPEGLLDGDILRDQIFARHLATTYTSTLLDPKVGSWVVTPVIPRVFIGRAST